MNNYKPFPLLIFLLIFTGVLNAKVSAKEGNPDHGKEVFQQCSVCHSLGNETDNKIGPTLKSIVGAKAASNKSFEYSKPLMAAANNGLVWDENKLNQFLESPDSFIPKNKMTYFGLKNEVERLDVIAFLKNPKEDDSVKGQTSGFSVSDQVLAIEGDREYGEYLASECFTCHRNGESNGEIPNIIGMSKNAFLLSLHAYKQKYRNNEVMQLVAGRLSNEEIASLSEYFKSLK